MYVLIRYSNVVMFGIGLTYMFSGIGARAAYGWSRRRRRRPIETSAVLQDAPQEEEAEKRDPPRFQ
jgi:hypothetical protein